MFPRTTIFLAGARTIVLLFVDDGSTDDTPLVLERLRQLHPRQVCTLRLGANVGKAEAVRRGVQVALRRGPANIGYWDADLATPLDAIPQFCDVLRARPDVRLVMGSRVALLGRQIRRSGTRHFLGRAFATAASIVLRLPVYDTQCGAKLFRATPAMAELFSRPFRARWIFDVEILARMMAAAAADGAGSVHESIYEYPLERWHDVSGSRLKSHDFLAAVIDLAGIYWRTLRRAKPRAASGGSLPRKTILRHPGSKHPALCNVTRPNRGHHSLRRTAPGRANALVVPRGGTLCGRWWSGMSAARPAGGCGFASWGAARAATLSALPKSTMWSASSVRRRRWRTRGRRWATACRAAGCRMRSTCRRRVLMSFC